MNFITQLYYQYRRILHRERARPNARIAAGPTRHDAERTLRTIVDWGLYAELLSYNNKRLVVLRWLIMPNGCWG